MSTTQYDTSDGFNVRLEARVKNGALVRARESLGFSIKKMAEEVGISYYLYRRYEAMQAYPQKEKQKKICEYFSEKEIFLIEEEVFPEELKTITSKKYIVERAIPKQQLISLDQVDPELLPYVEEGIESIIDENERYEIIESALGTLNEREAAVIKMRFGLGYIHDSKRSNFGSTFKVPGKPFERTGMASTLEEVADAFGVSKSRISQIEAKALRKLRKTEPRTMLKSII